MPLKIMQFAPGINKEGTQLTSSPSWYDCDKIRFRKGRPEQVGGWMKYTDSSYIGVARSIYDWGASSGSKHIGIGTSHKFYVEAAVTGSTENLFDITPIRETTAAGAATFAIVGAGDATLTVTDSSHGAVAGDYVTYTLAVTLGASITADVLNQEYRIATIVDGDNYTIEAKDDTTGDPVLAGAGDTGDGGAGTVAAYQINVGTNNYVPAVGYSYSTWSSGLWSGGGALSFAGQLRLYSQDNFADDLVFCPRNGGIYYWDESVGAGTRAKALSALAGASDAPTAALQVMVSQVDKHVIAIGSNPIGSASIDPMLVRWSDDETAADWTPTAINSAGGVVLSNGSTIVSGIKTRQEILIFTDTSLYAMRFSGAPYVFSFSVVGENISLMGPHAAINRDGAVFFMDRVGFYVYQGSVQPLECSVYNHVFSNLDLSQAHKTFAAVNPDNSEVSWYYQSMDGDDVDRYVTYNYQDNIWTVGTFDRAAWIHAPTKDYPLATSNITSSDPPVNYLYNQEYGMDAEGSDIGGYIESGSLSIADGENFTFMKRFIPDFNITGIENNAMFTVDIKGNDFPSETPATLASSTVLADTKQSHVRVRAREVALKISSSGNGYGWTMGDFRFDLRTSGRR